MASVKAFSIGGIGSQISLDDLVRISLSQCSLVLDPSGSERVKKMSPSPKQFRAEPSPVVAAQISASGGEEQDLQLSPHESRSIVATKLITLMNGRSGVRLAVCDHLMQLLNQNNTPTFPSSLSSDKEALNILADACYSPSSAATDSPSPSPPPPQLSAVERASIQGGASATAGVAALAIQGAKKLLSASTSILGLSVEALGAQSKPYDTDLLEAQNYKGAISVADELRTLLEGSKRVGTFKGSGCEEIPAFTSAPQVIGAAVKATGAAYDAVRSELQSESLPPLAPKSGGELIPHPPSIELPPALIEMSRALLEAGRVSVDRAVKASTLLPNQGYESLPRLMGATEHAMHEAREKVVAASTLLFSASSSSSSSPPPGFKAALALSSSLDALRGAVMIEAFVATAVLKHIDETSAAAAAAAAATHVPDPAPAPTTPAVEGQEETTAATAAITTATAAAAATAATADGPKKVKESKKSSQGGPLVLGKGTTVVMSWLSSFTRDKPIINEGQAPGLSLHSCDLIYDALDPLQGDLSRLLEEVKSVVEANQARRKPKVAKGARDFMPEQMAVREKAFGAITSVFKRHGAVSIDTPVFELRETLTGKYGEDSKLIYDLADQGGEILSLRYDLTVPFARYVACNNVVNIKRYHIGKVYRRDQPQMNRGRFREFFQCDFDIAGSYSSMVADSEVLKVLVEILSDLRLGEFEIKLNHRKLLDAMLDIAGVPPQKFRAICSAIDKLDKEPWSAVKAEMVEDKGLAEAVADKIGEMVVLRGRPLELLAKLMDPAHALSIHPGSRAALEELQTLFLFLEAMGALGPIAFDLSLARGLDYYTGVIYEAVLLGANVGSIAAGGRYDTLVGMFSGKDVPAVGVSIGIERVFAIMEAQAQERAKAAGSAIRATETQVLVASIGNGMQVRRMEVSSKLWAAGIKAEFGYKANPKMGDQLNHAFEQAIPFMVLFGDEELKEGVFKVKDIAQKTEEVVREGDLVEVLRVKIAAAASLDLFSPLK